MSELGDPARWQQAVLASNSRAIQRVHAPQQTSARMRSISRGCTVRYSLFTLPVYICTTADASSPSATRRSSVSLGTVPFIALTCSSGLRCGVARAVRGAKEVERDNPRDDEDAVFHDVARSSQAYRRLTECILGLTHWLALRAYT